MVCAAERKRGIGAGKSSRGTQGRRSRTADVVVPSVGDLGPDAFVLYVPDDAMAPRIRKGDTVVADEDQRPANGDLAAVKIGEDWLVRRWTRHGERVTLSAASPAFEKRTYAARAISVAARVLFIVGTVIPKTA